MYYHLTKLKNYKKYVSPYRYLVELNDLQILVGHVKDNWKFAHNKGTSSLHVLDRFNIMLQVCKKSFINWILLII